VSQYPQDADQLDTKNDFMEVEEKFGRGIYVQAAWVEGSYFTAFDFTILCDLVPAKQPEPLQRAVEYLERNCLVHSNDLKEISFFTADNPLLGGMAPKVSDILSQATSVSPNGLEYHRFIGRSLA
jgi:hypothetical protein